jgi:hypothetical protein
MVLFYGFILWVYFMGLFFIHKICRSYVPLGVRRRANNTFFDEALVFTFLSGFSYFILIFTHRQTLKKKLKKLTSLMWLILIKMMLLKGISLPPPLSSFLLSPRLRSFILFSPHLSLSRIYYYTSFHLISSHLISSPHLISHRTHLSSFYINQESLICIL